MAIYSVNCQLLKLDIKYFVLQSSWKFLQNIFGKLGIQIRYLFVLRGEMVKRGEKVVQKLQIVSDQSRIPKCTLDGSSGGTCKVLGKNTERCG